MVTPDQVADMARSLTLVDVAQRPQVYAALRCLAVTDPSHLEPFHEEFLRFFAGEPSTAAEAEYHSSPGMATVSKPIIASLAEETSGETETHSGASAVEKLASRDFAQLNDDELTEARRLVMAMLWEPTTFQTRRWVRARHGDRPDLRRTLRGAVGPKGELLPIEMKIRRLRRRPLIVIADISGSMEKYADMFLVFAHAAQRRLDQVEVFTFSTHLTRITDALNRRDARAALAGVGKTVSDWSGGTAIGVALAEWNKQWSRRLARGGPVVLVLSDGWDCGDPGLLSAEMARLARSVHRVYWLNPLAARADYRPATRGMRAVLPHIDQLLPAASVNDLRGVVRLLEAVGDATRPPTRFRA